MSETKAALKRLVTNLRRLWAQVLVGWLIKTVQLKDGETLASIAKLLDAMDRDSRNG